MGLIGFFVQDDSLGCMCVGGVLLHSSKGSGVQARQSPESQLEAEEGCEQQSPQDLKESMSSWNSVAYRQSFKSSQPLSLSNGHSGEWGDGQV